MKALLKSSKEVLQAIFCLLKLISSNVSRAFTNPMNLAY